MNESLAQAPHETTKYKEELEQRKQENDFFSVDLSKWVDEEGKLLTRVKVGIIENFCKSEEGKEWFLNLYMPVMNFSLMGWSMNPTRVS